MIEILFLERDSVDPDGIDLSPIERLGSVRYLDTRDPDEQFRAAKSADALIINKTVLTREFLAEMRLPAGDRIQQCGSGRRA